MHQSRTEDEGPFTPGLFSGALFSRFNPVLEILGFYLDKVTEYILKVLQPSFPERVDLRYSLENGYFSPSPVNIESGSLTLFFHLVSQSALIDW